MPVNDFLPFGIGLNANVLAAHVWNADSERIQGFEKGIAKSIKANTAWRHCSFITSAIAALIFETLQEDVLDNGVLSDFIGKLRRMLIDVTGGPDAPVDGDAYVRENGGWVLGKDRFLPLAGGDMIGWLTLRQTMPAQDWHATPKIYVDNAITGILNLLRNDYLPLAGTDNVTPPRMRGYISLHAYPLLEMHAAPKGYVDQEVGNLRTELRGNYLPLIGGQMLGYITLHADPVNPMQAATKRYVDNELERQLRGYLPLTGGRLYNRGFNDILIIEADRDRNARIIYNVLDTRQWRAGVDWQGNWVISDENAAAYRQRIYHTSGMHEIFHTGGHALALRGVPTEDNYIYWDAATNWSTGPQFHGDGRGRFVFYAHDDYRFVIYPDGEIWCHGNAYVGWDAVVGASVVIGTQIGVAHWLQNWNGSLYSSSRFVAFDFQSLNNCLVDGWLFVNGEGGITSQNGWISCWGSGLRTNNCLQADHLEISSWTWLGGGVYIQGLWPGSSYGLHIDNGAIYWGGALIAGGTLTVGNTFNAVSWPTGNIQMEVWGLLCRGTLPMYWGGYRGLVVDNVAEIGADLFVGHSVIVAGAPYGCGVVSSIDVWATNYISSGGHLGAGGNIYCGWDFFANGGIYAPYLRIDRGRTGSAVNIIGRTWVDTDWMLIGNTGQGTGDYGDLRVGHSISVAFAEAICGAVSSPSFNSYWGYNMASDQRFKHNIEPSNIDAVSAIRGLQFVQYDQAIDHTGEPWHESIGITAQQVIEVMPDVVVEFDQPNHSIRDWQRRRTTRMPAENPLGVNIASMTHYAMRGIQQLAIQNDTLIERIQALEIRIAELEGRA